MSTFLKAARDHIASRGSKQTRALYTSDLEKWLKFCTDHGFDPDMPTKEAAVAFRDAFAAGELTQEPPASATQRRILSALSSMYDAAGIVNRFKSSKYLHRPPADEVTPTPSFSPEEYRKIFAAIEADRTKEARRDELVITILYETGLRLSSVVKMERKALRKEDDQFTLITTVKKKGRVMVVIPKKSAALLEDWLQAVPSSKFVFPGARGNGPLAQATINRRLKEYGDSVGVKDAHPHRFRATFITEALDAGASLFDVQAAVHHSDPKTTLRYDRGVRGTGVALAVAKFREEK